MPVSNLYPVKIRWKSIRIEDRISTRFRKGPNVNQQTNSRLLQHIQKVVEAAVRMTDGGKARCHQSIFFRTFSLCAVTIAGRRSGCSYRLDVRWGSRELGSGAQGRPPGG